MTHSIRLHVSSFEAFKAKHDPAMELLLTYPGGN